MSRGSTCEENADKVFLSDALLFTAIPRDRGGGGGEKNDKRQGQDHPDVDRDLVAKKATGFTVCAVGTSTHTSDVKYNSLSNGS